METATPGAPDVLRLREHSGRWIIAASSQETALRGIPGHGWQPSSRAWEFDHHPGIIAIASDVLAERLRLTPKQRLQAATWRSSVTRRPGSRLTWAETRNAYVIYHGESDLDPVNLVPTRREEDGGSRFLKHPRIWELLVQLFGLEGDDPNPAVVPTRHPPGSPSAAAATPALQLSPTSPDGASDGHLRVAAILAVPTEATPAHIASCLSELRALDEDHAASAAASALARWKAARAVGSSRVLTDYLTERTGLGGTDEWVNAAVRFLGEAADGRHPWLDQLTATGIVHFSEPRIGALIGLACAVTDRRKNADRKPAWEALLKTLDWSERVDLLTGLPASHDWRGDVRLIAQVAAGLIDGEPLPQGSALLDLLSVSGDDPAMYRAALRAWKDQRLFSTDDVEAVDIDAFLDGAVRTFAALYRAREFEMAFDARAEFILAAGGYDELEELAGTHYARVPVKASLLLALSVCAREGSPAAAKLLIERYQRMPPTTPHHKMLVAEARTYAGGDAALRAECDRLSAQEPDAIPIGKVLIVGGDDSFGRRLEQRLGAPNRRGLDYTWASADDALSAGRMVNLARSHQNVLLYTWQLGHAASRIVHTAAERSGSHLRYASMPGTASLPDDLSLLLGRSER